MRNLTLTILLSFTLIIAIAQEKMLVPEEIMSNRSLYPTSLINLQWQDNSGYFTWHETKAVMRGHIGKEKNDTLITLVKFNEILTNAGVESVKRIPSISWRNEQELTFSIGNDYYTLNHLTGVLTKEHSLPEEAENADASAGGTSIAYTIGNNLFISNGSKKITVSSEKNKGVVTGQSVHRNEFGISKGTFWSPEGNMLAFYRMDESMVTEYPLVDITARVAELKNIRYPMAGMTSHHVTVGVYDATTGSTVFLKTGEPAEQYLTNIAWSPDQKYIFIAVLNRDQNHMKFNQYEVSTGNFVKTLFEETNERYVEPLNPMLFLPGNYEQFLWQSQRDGFNHIYLYNIDGQLVRQLTSGNWMVKGIEGFNQDAKGLFYTSTEASPIESHLYYVDLKTGKRKQLTTDKGTHRTNVRPDGKYFITTFSNLQTPSVTKLTEVKTGKSKELNRSDNPLKDYALGETSIFTIKAADDKTDLYCRLIKPANFDATKKYPVFIYVYGGPHAQLVTENWMSGGLFLQYMAQQGFVVFTLDNRGSANRGFEFESIIHRNVGKTEMVDQMKGVEYLKSLPFVDTNRIGVDGWSYGGFMTINLKLTYPDVFKVASAGGPVTDWKYYEVMYGERYMDTPEQNPEGYKASSLLERVDLLQGKLLIIHGGIDNTVVWQNSLDFLKTCIDQKKQVDYFVYPTHEHNVSGIDRAHLYRKIAEYFDAHL
jgi:dipeptidyl-peptidase 4